jgi:hypothetical protein
MSAINGLTLGFRADANVRIYKYTVMVKSAANVTDQNTIYAAVPAAKNAPGVLGVTVEHFVEPNFFIPQPSGTPGSGTNYPENITGGTPSSPYVLTGRGLTLQVNGVCRCIAGVAGIAQGEIVIVADAYGRVIPLSAAGLSPGDPYYQVGMAENGVSNLDDVVQVLLNFAPGVA